MNPYHDKRGRFTTASGAVSVTGPNAPVYGRGRQRGTGKQERIQRWSKEELAVPGKPSPTMWDGSKIAPMGKTAVLYHRTTKSSANALVSGQDWKPSKYADPYAFLSHGGVTTEEHIRGNSVISVRVPRRLIHKEFHIGKGTTYYMVNKKDMRGRAVTRVK